LSGKGAGKPLIIPIFIPNQGCPHRCIFCNQERITSQPAHVVASTTIREIIDTAVRSPRFNKAKSREIAFYGGTFTNLPKARMTTYLEAVKPYLDRGLFQSIRISTRPDALDPETLELLSRFCVRTVELGAQSMNDDVLRLSKRGHTARDTVEAVRVLKKCGFRVGIQLMPGLPGDSEKRFLETVERVVELQPDMTRLYPSVVIKDTEMADMFLEKKYDPLGLEEAVRICVKSCIRLEGCGIPVIRIGLMSSPTLLEEGQILGGPWHRAFGFLVRSRIHQEKIRSFLPGQGSVRKIRLRAPSREIPLVRGYRNRGLRFIEDETGAVVEGVVPDESLEPGKIAVDYACDN